MLVYHHLPSRPVKRLQVAMLLADITRATVSVSGTALDWPQRVLCPKLLLGHRIG